MSDFSVITAPNVSHFDANQIPSIMGVTGTLGTADVKGTATPLPISVDPSTGAMYVNNLGAGGSGGSNVNVFTGTQQTLGTVGVVNSGTLGLITRVGNIGTIESGTVTTTLALNTGTITTIVAGTQNTLGTVGTIPGIGIVTRVGNLGTIESGTISSLPAVSLTSSGTILNLATGTIASLPAVSLTSSGTILNLAAGTITSLLSQSAGTLNTLGTVGVINSGTIQVSPIPPMGQIPNGVHGTTGATVFGTLAGGTGCGAGTEIFVTSLSLSAPASAGSQDVSIGFGTNAGTFHAGTGRLVRGMFPAGGGIVKFFDPPINSGTNANLTYFQAGAGTVEIDYTGFIIASTI